MGSKKVGRGGSRKHPGTVSSKKRHNAKHNLKVNLKEAQLASTPTHKANPTYYARTFLRHRLDEMHRHVYPPSKLGEHIYISDLPREDPDVGWRLFAKQATQRCNFKPGTWRDASELTALPMES